MEYVDITKCYEVLMNYIDEDFTNGHEEQCKNHFLSYIQENNGDELKHKNGMLLVPAYFYSGKYILDYIKCQTAHCGRGKPHFDFGENPSPIVPYRNLPQAQDGMTADYRSLV